MVTSPASVSRTVEDPIVTEPNDADNAQYLSVLIAESPVPAVPAYGPASNASAVNVAVPVPPVVMVANSKSL